MIREAQKQDIPAIALLERECQEVPWSEQLLFDSFAPGTNMIFLSTTQAAKWSHTDVYSGFWTKEIYVI